MRQIIPPLHCALIIVTLFSAFVGVTHADCAFTVDNDGIPRTVKPKEVAPSVHIYSTPFICEKIFAGPNCCNDYQNNQMASNFLQIDATFGSQGGGCDQCGSNLKRFWCMYTCHPNQSAFTTISPNKVVVPNPIDEGQTTLLVMDVHIIVDSQTVCDIWSSCNMTPYATQVSAMKTPAGFLAFQGANAVTQAAQTIGVSYNSEPDVASIKIEGVSMCDLPQPPVNPDITRRQPWYPDIYGFNISEPCACNNCASSCVASEFNALPVMEGFNWQVVGVCYGAVMVLTIGCWFYRKKRLEHKLMEQKRQEEFDIIQDSIQNNTQQTTDPYRRAGAAATGYN